MLWCIAKIVQLNQYAKNALNINAKFNYTDITIMPTGNIQGDLVEYVVDYNKINTYFLAEKYDNILNEKFHIAVFLENDCSHTKREKLNKNFGVSKIIGLSPCTVNLRKEIKEVAQIEENVFIVPKIGSKVKMYAQIIHEESARAYGKLIEYRCTDNQDFTHYELFGDKKNKGKLFAASKGMILIEDIDKLSLVSQDKLLQLIKQRDFELKKRKVTPIILSCTNKNLEDLCEENLFLWELYYLLSVRKLILPAVNERKSDIKEMIMIELAKRGISERKIKNIGDETWSIIEKCDLEKNESQVSYIVKQIEIALRQNRDLAIEDIALLKLKKEIDLDFNLERIERRTIENALNYYGNNYKSKQIVAQKLGIGIATLYKKLKYYSLE